MSLTQKRLKELLYYNQDTGIFSWNVSGKKRVRGKVLNSVSKLGYIRIGVDRKRYLAHRLAWFYVYGYFPEHGIDHIDRNKTNNAISNLREVSQTCNIRNTGNQTNTKSGVKGVCWSKEKNKWRAYIKVGYTHYHIKYCDDFKEAVAHRLATEQSLNWHDCDSNSPAFLYLQRSS